MKDQASTLRMISPGASSSDLANERADVQNKNIPCVALAGGKGGTGKSNLAVNLALELGAYGSRTMLLDADFGLANADVLCGITPEFHLGHAIFGLKEPEEIAVKLSENVSLIPSGNGIEELANLSLSKHTQIFTRLEAMQKNFDFMLIDTAAGIAKNVVGVLISASQVLIVVTPDPASIIDAYATIKVILRYAPAKQISIVVNMANSIMEAERIFEQIRAAVKNFLNNQVEFLGAIPNDLQVVEATRQQTPLTLFAPAAPASRAIRLIARQLRRRTGLDDGSLEGESFWNSVVNNWEN